MNTQKRILNILLIISILLTIWINFFKNLWITIPIEINPENINKLVESLSIAYFTSYAFYFVVVRIKEKQDKKMIYPFIAECTYLAMNKCVIFSSTMRSFAGLESINYDTGFLNRNLDIYPNKADLKLICKNINPNKESSKESGLNGFRTIPHFFGLMIKYTYDIDYYITIILNKSNFIDTELILLLTKIQTHGYHQWMLSYEKSCIFVAQHRHNDLIVFEKSFDSYFTLFRKLEKYSEMNLKKYKLT